MIEVLIVYLVVYSVTLIVEHKYIEQLYIIPLIIFSIQHNIAAQLLNILMYSLFVLFISKREYNLGEILLQYCIILSAFISSLFHQNRIIEIKLLKEELKRSEEKLESSKKYINYLEDVIDKLKAKLIYENEGISTLMLDLSWVYVEDLREFAYIFLEKVTTFLEIKKAGFYLYRNGFLRVIASIGNPSIGFSASENQSLVIKKALEKGSCSIFEVFNQVSHLEREPLLAVRVGEEKIIGVIIVEELEEPILLNSIEKNLKILSVWLATKLEGIEEEMKKYKLPDGTYTVDFYNKIKQRLADFFEKYGLPFSEICISIHNDELKSVLKVIRSDDIIAKIKDDGNRISLKILLPFCDEIGQISIMERLKHVSKTIEFSGC